MQDALSKQQTRQKYQSSVDRITTSLSPAHQRGEKNSPPPTRMQAQVTLYTKLTQTTGLTLRGQKSKERRNSTLKPGKRRPQTQYYNNNNNNNEKADKYCTKKEQTRDTQVQINEEEIGKVPEEEFRIMIVWMIQNLENKMEKMQESINKDVEELKNKHTETNNKKLKLKIPFKESIPEYLKQKNRSMSWKIEWWE